MMIGYPGCGSHSCELVLGKIERSVKILPRYVLIAVERCQVAGLITVGSPYICRNRQELTWEDTISTT